MVGVWTPDSAGGRVKEGFLKEEALKPRQRIRWGLAGGRKDGVVFQEGEQYMQTPRGNRKLSTFRKL